MESWPRCEHCDRLDPNALSGALDESRHALKAERAEVTRLRAKVEQLFRDWQEANSAACARGIEVEQLRDTVTALRATPPDAGAGKWPERLVALREQYEQNPTLHATKVAYINGLVYEYNAVLAATPADAGAVRRLVEAIRARPWMGVIRRVGEPAGGWNWAPGYKCHACGQTAMGDGNFPHLGDCPIKLIAALTERAG